MAGLRLRSASGSSVSLTGGSTITPAANTLGLTIVSPANTSAGGALRLTNRAGDGGGGTSDAQSLLTLATEGSANALNVFGYAGSTAPALLGVHQYQATSVAVQFDATDASGVILKLVNTQNSSANPGHHGSADLLQMWGYRTFDTTSTGASTGSNTLTDAAAAFAAEDVGKPIKISTFTGTIATVVSATQITYSGIGGLADGNYSYSYAKNAGKMLYVTNDLVYNNASTVPVTYLSTTGATKSLAVQQGASGTVAALDVSNQGTGAGISVSQSGAGVALNLSQTGAKEAIVATLTSAAAGFYGTRIVGYDYGLQASSTANSGITLSVSKTGTGAGSVAVLNNAGTGSTLVIQTAGTSSLEINANGDLFISKTGGLKIGTATTQKIGLYAATPVAQATRVGQLTDSTTGTPSTTIGDAGAAYSQATINNIHASLLAKINALESRLSAAGGGIGITA